MKFKMLVELTTDIELINKVLDNPLVYQMVNGTGEVSTSSLSYREELTKKGFSFLSISVEEELIGVFTFRELTHASVESHVHILPEYHKKGYGKQAVIAGLEWFKCNKKALQIITYVPSNCFHVLKFMQDNDFIARGSIPDAIYYNNELVNLYIFSRGL